MRLSRDQTVHFSSRPVGIAAQLSFTNVPVRRFASIVNGTRNQFFPCTGFAIDQNGGIRWGDRFDLI